MRSSAAHGVARRHGVLPNAIRTYYNTPMPKSTTSVRLPEELIAALDQRAAALGLTRSEVIVQAVEQALEQRSAWSPRFLKAIGTPRRDLEEIVDQMMEAIRESRSRSEAPGL